MTAVIGSPLPATPEGDPAVPSRRKFRSARNRGDLIFDNLARLSGILVLAIMASIGVFLLAKALKALRAVGFSFVTTQAWNPDTHHFGIAALLPDTVLIALVAITVAVPLSLGMALFISEVAPLRIKRFLISLIDLMAAVPSVVFGLWGLKWLEGHVIGVARWMSTWLAWIPIFRVPGADPSNPLATSTIYTAGTFMAGLVVGLMVSPIACSIMREAFSQAPIGEREGALALGATRWGMIRSVVLPFGRGGIIGGVMLGLGRALGETIAIYLIVSPNFHIDWHILHSGANSVAATIALRYSDSSPFGLSALMAAGFALFILTLIVNFSASAIVNRSRSGAESEV